MASFLIEEFKENWSYIRHMEEIRIKHEHAFLIIIGAMISLFSYLIKSSGYLNFDCLITNYRAIIIPVSGFVFLYGFFLCIFLAYQKRGYENYRIVNAEIRNWFTKQYGEENQFSFESKLLSKRKLDKIINPTFFIGISL
jgi:hypothetical protein